MTASIISLLVLLLMVNLIGGALICYLKRHRSRSSARSPETLGWTLKEALDTRARLASFAEDWERPDMALYDHEKQ
ncbi:MAG: hypothetical protein K9L88_02380 [Chromatiaceae bacterium]|nr:hypothetical protein [Chromatiaceae bacterium]